MVQDTFDDTSLIDLAQSSHYVVESGSVHLGYTFSIDTGDGADGAAEVQADANLNTDILAADRTSPDGEAFAVSALGTSSITVTGTGTGGTTAANLSQSITTGDEVLLIDLQGSPTNYSRAGNFEFCDVNFVLDDTITCTEPLQETYGETDNTDLTDQKVMVQRVPHYTDLTIDAGFKLTASAWNGTLGGVVAFRANGTVDVEGTIDVTGKGYRGGDQPGGQTSGRQGESIDGVGAYAHAANLGGGGGAGPGVAGGGGGGYAVAGDDGAAQDPSVRGLGGQPYGANPLTQLFLGSGGGAGWDTGPGPIGPDAGGKGGGIIFVAAEHVTNGTISSGGTHTSQYGSGGIGSGGSIEIQAADVSSDLVLVRHYQYAAAGSSGYLTLYYLNSWTGTATGQAYTQQRLRWASGVVQSVNLLDGTSASAVVGFGYDLTDLPQDTTLVAQFSPDGTTWYDAAGTDGQSEALQAGAGQYIDLSAGGWSGNAFYYRLIFNSTGADTPHVDAVRLYYLP